jgi:hypothetical protein
MIVAYVGLPGGGKTYLMTLHLLEEMKRHRRAWVNYPVSYARGYSDLKQVLNVRKGIIAADELQMIAPSRAFRSLPTSYFQLWTQGRHMGIDFWYTCQSFHRVDVSIRSVTNYVWVCKRVFGRYHVAKMYDADDIERERRKVKPLKTKHFLLNKRIFRSYDTFHMVKPPSHLEKTTVEDIDPDDLPIFGGDLEPIGSTDPTYEDDMDFLDENDQDSYPVFGAAVRRGRASGQDP